MPLKGYGPESFGEAYAAIYDAIIKRDDAEQAADFLASLADGRPALELAIGTGRVALPLLARGVDVSGIDASEAMVAKMRSKPGGDQVAVTISDLADIAVEGRFGLIYIVFNSLFNLTTQDDQVRCFENVAKRLARGGAFVVEAFVPDLRRYDAEGGYVGAETVEMDRVVIDFQRHDAVMQIIDESHVFLSQTGVRLYPMVTRYSWPSELDLMARLAGLTLRDRFGGWNREPFTAESRSHVSVYSA